jgi:hypothetical protein
VGNEVKLCKRSWPTSIYIVQTEDPERFGFHFYPVPKFAINKGNEYTMMTWVLTSIVSSCKSLWHIISQKESFSTSDWEGWLLTYISSNCLKYQNTSIDRKSPFSSKHISAIPKIVGKIQSHFQGPQDENEEDEDGIDHETSFRFDSGFMNAIFQEDRFPSIAIMSSIDDVLIEPSEDFSDKEVIIVVAQEIPLEENATFEVDNNQFEIQVILWIKIENVNRRHPSKDWNGIRFCRHGGFYSNWWRQEKNSSVVTHCRNGGNAYHELDQESIGFRYISVYATKKDIKLDEATSELMRSIGGQTHVHCSCNNLPLIPSRRKKNKKRQCGVGTCTSRRKFESFECCSLHCTTR